MRRGELKVGEVFQLNGARSVFLLERLQHGDCRTLVAILQPIGESSRRCRRIDRPNANAIVAGSGIGNLIDDQSRRGQEFAGLAGRSVDSDDDVARPGRGSFQARFDLHGK